MVDGDAMDPLLYLGGCNDVNLGAKEKDNELQNATEAMKSTTISSKKLPPLAQVYNAMVPELRAPSVADNTGVPSIETCSDVP